MKAKIKAGPRDPRQIKTNIQIDDRGATRQVWTIIVTDGSESKTLTTTTAGASNSLDRDVFTGNGAGADANQPINTLGAMQTPMSTSTSMAAPTPMATPVTIMMPTMALRRNEERYQ